jgi:hypothetical protein
MKWIFHKIETIIFFYFSKHSNKMSVLTNLYGPMGLYALWIILHFIAPHLYVYFCTPATFVGFITSPFIAPAPTLDNIHWRRYDKFYVGYSRGLVRPNPCFQNQKCRCSLKWLFIVFYKISIFHKIENLFSQVTKSININLVTKTFDKTL